MTAGLDPTRVKERSADAKRYQSKSCQRAPDGRWRPKWLEARAAAAGEAQSSGQTPKAKPLRKAKRWNKGWPA